MYRRSRNIPLKAGRREVALIMIFSSAQTCNRFGRRKEAAVFPPSSPPGRGAKKKKLTTSGGFLFVPRALTSPSRRYCSALEIARFFARGSLLLDSPAAFPSLSLALLIAANGKLRAAGFLVSALENSMAGRPNDYSRGEE